MPKPEEQNATKVAVPKAESQEKNYVKIRDLTKKDVKEFGKIQTEFIKRTSSRTKTDYAVIRVVFDPDYLEMEIPFNNIHEYHLFLLKLGKDVKDEKGYELREHTANAYYRFVKHPAKNGTTGEIFEGKRLELIYKSRVVKTFILKGAIKAVLEELEELGKINITWYRSEEIIESDEDEELNVDFE